MLRVQRWEKGKGGNAARVTCSWLVVQRGGGPAARMDSPLVGTSGQMNSNGYGLVSTSETTLQGQQIVCKSCSGIGVPIRGDGGMQRRALAKRARLGPTAKS